MTRWVPIARGNAGKEKKKQQFASPWYLSKSIKSWTYMQPGGHE
ncbi:MAG: hypothetical protein ABL967_18030 [Bryobacteraceae bacterium]